MHEREIDVGVDNQYSNGYKPIFKRRPVSIPPNPCKSTCRKRRHLSASGNFIDCRNIPSRNCVQELHAFSKWSTSVCQIRFGNKTATGFRVGSRYNMTAYHVVLEIISTVSPSNGQCHFNTHVPALKHGNVFCLFNYFRDCTNVRKYYLMAYIHFFDKETDTAVLELADDPDGLPMPEAFRILGFLETKFSLFGHMGGAMEYNTVSLLLIPSRNRQKNTLSMLSILTIIIPEKLTISPYNILKNNKRILFHCKFGKGASDSPGISVQEDGRVIVVTMVLCGYPNWYYNEHIDRKIVQNWPKEYCIEQGTNLL